MNLFGQTQEDVAGFFDNRLQQPGIKSWNAFHYRSARDQRIRQKMLIRLAGSLKGKSVLDVGCGTGDLLRYIPASADYYGIDVSPRAIKVARAAWPGREFACTTELRPADVVFGCAVLQCSHIPPEEMIRAMWEQARELVVFNCWRGFADLGEASAWWAGLGATVAIFEGYDIWRGGDRDFSIRLSR